MSETPPSSAPDQPAPPRTLFLESLPKTDPQPEDTHPICIGPYRLQRPLGQGGIADIHLAIDEEGRPVAIKQVRPELALDPLEQARLEREAIALGRLEHPSVLRLHAAGHDGKSQRPYLACEFVQGLHLHDFVQRLSGPPPELAAWVGLLLARALTAAHAAHIIHRDLKPTNVMIDMAGGPSQGRLVLIDYGSALLTDLPPLTPSGYPVGTPGFAAPEQLDRTLGMPPGTIDARADVYGLGVLLYTLVAKGRRPFTGQDLPELLQAMARERYEPLSRIDPRVPSYLEKAVARCLRFRPADRPTVAELHALLSQGLTEDGFDDAAVEMRRLVADPAQVVADFGARLVQMMAHKSLILVSIGWHEEAEETYQRALAWKPTDLRQYALLKRIRNFTEAEAESVRERLEELHLAIRVQRVREDATLADLLSAEEEEDGQEVEDEDEEDADEDDEDEESEDEDDEDEESADGDGEEGEDEVESEDKEAGETRAVEMTASERVGEAVASPRVEPAQPLPEVQEPVIRPWWRRKKRQAVLLVAAAVAILVGLRAGSELRYPGGPKPFQPPLALRELDGRTSNPAGAEYIPYPLGQEPDPAHKAPTPDLAVLNEMKKQGDFHGVATAYLLAGDLGQAEVYLDLAAPHTERGEIGEAGAPASRHPDIDSDRAIVEMNRGHFDQALQLVDSVLRARREHRPAKWNRALVLGRLDLGLAAAALFDDLKSLDEPGWSVEAGQRAAYLRRPIEERRKRWWQIVKVGREMATGGPVTVDLVARAPGYARLYFYDAVRAAPDATRVRSLLPLAVALDEYHGGDDLQRYVRKIAARPFARRSPLAKTYAELVANYDHLDAPGQDRYLTALRQSGEDDLLLGTLTLIDRVQDHLAEYHRLAIASGDPWFLLIADTEEAKAEAARGEHRRAEARLLTALDTCQRYKMEYRCAWIELALVNVYRSMDLLSEAEAHARSGRALAQKTSDWQTETLFLHRFGDIAQARNDVSLSKAFLDEIEWRDPAECERQRYRHETRAHTHMHELRFAEARREILQVPTCHKPRTLRTASVLAYLDRVGVPAAPWLQVRAELAELRLRGGLSPGEVALAVHFEGVLLLGHDRREGERLLRQAQILSEYLRTQDLDAQIAYAYSLKELALAAGQAGEFARAQALLAEAHRYRATPRCTLGRILDGQRSLVLVANPNGQVRGRYDLRPTETSDGGLKGPEVPESGTEDLALGGSLDGCAEIDVFSEPPLPGQPGVLPPDKAWAFHNGRPALALWRKSVVRRLIVTAPLLRSREEAARLTPWNSPRKEGEMVTTLQGQDATPERVLEEIPRATEVVLHVPCVFKGGEQELLLSPGQDGKDTLTVRDVLRVRLPNVRLVTLTTCRSHPAAGLFEAPWDLPSALTTVGVGAVLAAYDVNLDAGAAEFFDDVAARIRTAQPPAVALRDVRMTWIDNKKKAWVRQVVVYH